MEGSISLRKDGRYMGRIYENGKPKCLYARTKKEIVEKMKQEIKQKKQREKQESTTSYYSLTFGDFAKDYMEIFKKPTLKESTYQQSERILKRFNQERIYRKKIRDITHTDLKEFYDDNDTKYTTYNLFKDIFEKAKEVGITTFNPFCMVVKPKKIEFGETLKKKNKNNSDILNSDEIDKILNNNYRNPKFNVFFKLLLLTGLRIGEALALTINDINLEKKELYVNKQIMIMVGKITSTKSKKANRTVPLFDETIELLNSYLKKLENNRLFDFSYKKVNYQLIILSEKIGRKIKCHMFRKTFVSKMQFDFGIPTDVIAEWVGHTNINITKEYYTFITDDANKSAIDAINKKMKK